MGLDTRFGGARFGDFCVDVNENSRVVPSFVLKEIDSILAIIVVFVLFFFNNFLKFKKMYNTRKKKKLKKVKKHGTGP